MMQRKYWLCCQVYLLLAGAFVFSPAEAQNSSSRQHKWSVGERVEVYVVEPHSPTGKMIWRPGVITEVFGWGGAHVRFDNGDVESIGAYNPDADGANPPNLAARPVDSTSGATSAPMTAPTTAPTSAPHPDKAPPTKLFGVEGRVSWIPEVFEGDLPARTSEQLGRSVVVSYQHPDHDTGPEWRPRI